MKSYYEPGEPQKMTATIEWHDLRDGRSNPPDNDRTVIVTVCSATGARYTMDVSYRRGFWWCAVDRDKIISERPIAWAERPQPFEG